MNLFDLISFILIVGLSLWGIMKGFIIEISEIGGLIISFILAMYFPLGLNIGGMKYFVSFLVYFFTISIGFSILSKMIHKTPLAIFDRILGALIGAIKGFIIAIILFLIISLVPMKGRKSDLNNSFFYRLALVFRPPIKDFLRKRMKDLNQYKKNLPLNKIPKIKELQKDNKNSII